METPSRSILGLLLFLSIMMIGGFLIGQVVAVSDWYDTLNKPWFHPPDWIFAPIWTTFYILIAIAGWLTWTRDTRGFCRDFWVAQAVLNFTWAPIFFAAQEPEFAFAVIVLLLGSIIGFILCARKIDRYATIIFSIYGLWVVFAGLLNLSVIILNP